MREQPVILTHLYVDADAHVVACQPEPVEPDGDSWPKVPRRLCPGCRIAATRERDHDWWVRAVDGVLTLHSKRTFHGDGYGWAVCAECRQAWPCATVKAIDAERP